MGCENHISCTEEIPSLKGKYIMKGVAIMEIKIDMTALAEVEALALAGDNGGGKCSCNDSAEVK
jgi:hypothetical protein